MANSKVHELVHEQFYFANNSQTNKYSATCTIQACSHQIWSGLFFASGVWGHAPTEKISIFWANMMLLRGQMTEFQMNE